MTRTGTITWSVLGIIGFVFLLVCGICVAILGFAFSIDAPHAWKGDVRDGLIFGLIALALVIAAILLLRNSIRRLRSLRKTNILEGRSSL
jgi:multisubunit Na+/H+ antiporter MnhB subunit